MHSYIHEVGDKPYLFPHLSRNVETALHMQVCKIQEKMQTFPCIRGLDAMSAMTAVKTQKQT